MLFLLVFSAAATDCSVAPASMVPNGGTVDVPVDVVISWATDQAIQDRPPVLTDADGGIVPMTVTWVPSAGGAVYGDLTPEAPLAPGVTYTVTDPWDTYTFTTGDIGESGVPGVPTVATVEAEADNGGEGTCEGSTRWAEQEQVYVRLGVETVVDGYVEARVQVDGAAPVYARGGPAGVSLAWGACYTGNLPNMDDAQSLTVSVRAVAYDGQASDWSAEQAVAVPWPGVPDCQEAGCVAAPASPWALGVIVAMGAMVGRRREG
ncbi:MAG: Ig-like domain-containing protein [Myxococcota bacterium]